MSDVPELVSIEHAKLSAAANPRFLQAPITGRCPRDLPDIDGLARCIEALGVLLHPLVLKPPRELVCGQRRLEAVKRLGWTRVPFYEVDIDEIVRGELAENVYRKDFTPSEMVAIVETAEAHERELARQRMTLGKVSLGSEAGKTIDKVAAPLGVSGRTLEKAKAIVQARRG